LFWRATQRLLLHQLVGVIGPIGHLLANPTARIARAYRQSEGGSMGVESSRMLKNPAYAAIWASFRRAVMILCIGDPIESRAIRGKDQQSDGLFSYIRPETRVPAARPGLSVTWLVGRLIDDASLGKAAI
jgi:hypothetical protein